MATVAYERGMVANGYTDYNFISAFDVIKESHDPRLISPFGSGKIMGILDATMGGSVEVTTLEYTRWERKRLMPKILASNAGAGAANGPVEFTLDAAAGMTEAYNHSPMISTYTKDFYVPRAGDTILIKPVANIAYGNYIHALITEVDTAAGTFIAYPMIAGEAIPAVDDPDEIVIYGQASGEATGFPVSQDGDIVKFTNNIQTIKDEYQFSDYASNLQTWIEIEGRSAGGWVLNGEAATMNKIMNNVELTLLVGAKLTNTTLADLYNQNQVITTNGLLEEILTYGNTYNYGANTTDFGYDDFEELADILNKQGGSKRNMFWVGFKLRAQMDKFLRSEAGLVGGGIVYGVFNWDDEKRIAFGFDSVKISGYTFDIKIADAFSDPQTLGAAGYNFESEGIIIPSDSVVDGQNQTIPALRKRYYKGYEWKTSTIDYEKLESGLSKFGVRYHTKVGLEANGLNRYIYVRKLAA